MFDGGKAGTTLYVYSFCSLLFSCQHHWPMRERERIMSMPLISRCDVHTTMLCAKVEEEERFIFHSRWSCVYCMCTSCSVWFFWSAITTTMSNSKEKMTKKQQDDLASTLNSRVSFFLSRWELLFFFTYDNIFSRPPLGPSIGFSIDVTIRSISSIWFTDTKFPIIEQFSSTHNTSFSSFDTVTLLDGSNNWCLVEWFIEQCRKYGL